MIKKLFIINAKAGGYKSSDLERKIISCYKKAGRLNELEIIKTSYPGHGAKAALEFSKSNYDKKVVYACGGDGTLNELANVLANSDTGLGLIPMGTGNDFSKNFDYKNFKLEDTFDPILSPVDLIEINERFSINVASLGFDSYVLINTYKLLEKYPSIKSLAFTLGVIKSLLKIKYYRLSFNLTLLNKKKVELNGDYLICAICNGSYYGSGYNPAPDAKIDDGYLNLIVLPKIPLVELPSLILKYKKGRHLSSRYVKEYKVLSGEIKADKKIPANVDGELFSSDKFSFKIKRSFILFHKPTSKGLL
ncbi:diacylglycerol/lipid kinase family protein [Peptoniphilus catoniae]|uniref:diacylglycerol/lipid kinase family protein n=1 Tax=Peptoniphilus catoniae TaxID=1660341 RepID=UPI0010FD3710|nr:YegS/Rv2252/BmrU family lipid kinase [Peptoniphilus catoniae]